MSRAGTLATITPRPDASECEADDCTEHEGLATVEPHDSVMDDRTLCGDCRLEYFEELRA